ncbi:MAG: PA-phosphatase, partial [Burkholderiales bacterium]
GDLDGNSATEQDLGWTSLVDAPLHPEYPCAHCNTSAAFGTVVLGLAPPGKRLVIRSGNNPPREYESAAALAAEVVNARVWSGIHFRNSAETGAAMGKRVGEYILMQLKPLP